MIRYGAHVSAAGGISKAVERAIGIGAETIQIFGSPPQSFNPPKHAPEEIREFKVQAKKYGIGPIYLHAPYLVNLATPRSGHLEISVQTLIKAMNLAGELGAEGVIFHTGSSLGARFEDVSKQIMGALKEILHQTPSLAKLIIENSAGSGGTIGDSPAEIGNLIKGTDSARLYTCLDTQHAFAAGYDLTTDGGIAKMISDWQEHVGLDRLVALHVNDSKVPMGSHRDRHANIGEGLIGKTGFRLMKENNILNKLPWIIEVPGFSDKGPDKANLDILKSL